MEHGEGGAPGASMTRGKGRIVRTVVRSGRGQTKGNEPAKVFGRADTGKVVVASESRSPTAMDESEKGA